MDETSAGRLPLTADEILRDYRVACASRAASVAGRREVLTGKAKFGIFGDGKELPQLALARAFRKGDWRSGYYRDQTWMLALGIVDLRGFFAQLYGHADLRHEPAMGGRSMNAHFASRLLGPNGEWLDQTAMYNSVADLSPTASQMPHAVGLAYASVLYRALGAQGTAGSQGTTGARGTAGARGAAGAPGGSLGPEAERFSKRGNEVVWVSIGDGSAAEGLFWESVNAIGVLGGPAVISVYDDGYGISVPTALQLAKGDIGALLRGFERDPAAVTSAGAAPEGQGAGFRIRAVKAWDYPALVEAYEEAGRAAREEHLPTILHLTEATQPLGHSTSGSHERYKSPERLAWEAERDCLPAFRGWILREGIAGESGLVDIEAEAAKEVDEARAAAYAAYLAPLLETRDGAAAFIRELAEAEPGLAGLDLAARALERSIQPTRREAAAAAHAALELTQGSDSPERRALASFSERLRAEGEARYGSQLYAPAGSPASALSVAAVPPRYSDSSPEVKGFELINAAFDAALSRDPRILAFGEDVGKLGDVNQGFRGLQEKYGPLRVADAGIREATILGQAIGLALRGFRPIAEIQYLDYLLYALQLMADDLSTLRWRSVGGQAAPVIVRTRGHRLEGIWHAGSPMSGILGLVRGMRLVVPRDFTRAAGFYNSLLAAEEPAIVIEPLNGYRRKERLPDNLGETRLPLGVPERLREGRDLTIVTYGSTTRVVLEAADRLAAAGVEAEVMDAQTLLPFDLEGRIGESLRKTARVLFVDEDLPGGATAYMMREVLERQGGFDRLDAGPRTLTAAEHRPAYGTDGDYWSKPNVESVIDAALSLAAEGGRGGRRGAREGAARLEERA